MTDVMTMEQATERVARGMAWIMENADTLDLDLNRVDPGTVNVVNDHNCVLAQAGGRFFWDILRQAGVRDISVDGQAWTVHYGFATPSTATVNREAVTLAEAWRSALSGRSAP